MTLKHKPLDAEKIRSELDESLGTQNNRNVSIFKSVDSTNAWLLENGNCGDICLSETQTAGRGRRNNEWVSPLSGNVYLSYCACVDNSIKHRSLLGLVIGVAVAEALDEIGLSGHGVKWPNDIFWQRKKLGGILIETSTQSDKFIIGLGLNLTLSKMESDKISQASVTLDQAMGVRNYSRDDLVILLIQKMSYHLGVFRQLDFKCFLKAWESWDVLRGEKIDFEHRGAVTIGTVKDIDRHGRLGVLLGNGEQQYFSAIDIKLHKPAS